MVAAIRQVEQAMGSPVKAPTAREAQNRAVVRKSVVAATLIRKGEAFSPENLTVKRPGEGMSPMRLWDVIGKRATRAYLEDEGIEP